jgi:hypothetical protein
MSPRAQNLLSLGVLAVALAISSFPEKSQTLATQGMKIQVAEGKPSR